MYVCYQVYYFSVLFYLWTQWFVVQAVLLLLFNKFPYFSIVANEPDVSLTLLKVNIKH